MPIWSKPEDEHYRGPAIYRLIVNGQNYCGKTFKFRKRMSRHKSAAKLWKERLARGEHVQDVHFCISDGWINVTIEIIQRYPDKIKGVEADELFMDEREIEAIAFYDSYRNGLNMDEGGRFGVSKRLLGNQHALGSTRTAAQKQAMSQRMKGNQIMAEYHRRPEVRAATSQRMMGNQYALGYEQSDTQKEAMRVFQTGRVHSISSRQKRSSSLIGHEVSLETAAKIGKANSKALTATMGAKTWKFESCRKASDALSNEFGEKFYINPISKACRGKWGKKKNLSTYKGIHFIYD